MERADVGIDGDRIVAIGDLSGRQGAVEDREALAPDASCAGLASGAALLLAVIIAGASAVEAAPER